MHAVEGPFAVRRLSKAVALGAVTLALLSAILLELLAFGPRWKWLRGGA